MFEFVLGFLFSWIFVGFLITAALFCEYKESHGWTVFYTIVLGFILYHMLGLNGKQLATYAAAYLPIGFVWSFWRWKRRCDKVVDRAEAQLIAAAKSTNGDRYLTKTHEVKAEAAIELNPARHTDLMSYWVIGWPFSFVEMFIHDLVNLIERTIKKIAAQTYQRMTDKALSRIDDRISQPRDEMRVK